MSSHKSDILRFDLIALLARVHSSQQLTESMTHGSGSCSFGGSFFSNFCKDSSSCELVDSLAALACCHARRSLLCYIESFSSR